MYFVFGFEYLECNYFIRLTKNIQILNTKYKY
jgi:hypothetical protein